jgi:hypothetical protein
MNIKHFKELFLFQVNLKGCEVTPEINLSQHKYQIKLEIPSAEGMTEMWLRLSSVSDNIFYRVLVGKYPGYPLPNTGTQKCLNWG